MTPLTAKVVRTMTRAQLEAQEVAWALDGPCDGCVTEGGGRRHPFHRGIARFATQPIWRCRRCNIYASDVAARAAFVTLEPRIARNLKLLGHDGPKVATT